MFKSVLASEICFDSSGLVSANTIPIIIKNIHPENEEERDEYLFSPD